MKKIFLISILCLSLLDATLFTIKDKYGNILERNNINHKKIFSLQKKQNYSISSIYKQLSSDVNFIKEVENANKKILNIKIKQETAKKRGKEYRATKIEQRLLLQYAKFYKGGRYVWGGTTPNGFDCSGYVQYVYKKQNIYLPRTAYEQSQVGEKIDMLSLKKGDLVFFLTDKSRKIPVTHVGIYIGDGNFIHAASQKDGIIISPLMFGHYSETFVEARRMRI